MVHPKGMHPDWASVPAPNSLQPKRPGRLSSGAFDWASDRSPCGVHGVDQIGTGNPAPEGHRGLAEELEDERRRLIGLCKDGDPGLLQDLGADKLTHAAGDIGVSDTAVRRGGVFGRDGN